MKLIDLDQTIFVPIIDESKGGVKYEMQMTVAEMFDKFFEEVQPEVVDAMPVEWMENMLDETATKNVELNNAIFQVLVAWEREKQKEATENG